MFALHLKERTEADAGQRPVEAEPVRPRRETPDHRRHRSVPVSILRGWGVVLVGLGTIFAALALVTFVWTPVASAATSVGLGTAAPFAVLAGQEVTDVPTSSITGDVGLSPATGGDYAGLTKAEVTGTIYSTDAAGPGGSSNDPALLTQAKNDLTTAFVSAAGQPTTTTFTTGDNQLGGKTLTAGVYAFGHAASANITAASPLTLNGQGNANSVFVFQASSDLVTASNSVVQLVNGAQACNVFWEVDSSATLSSASTFVGTLMALTSATLDTGATVHGRILARNGAVTLDANTITIPTACAAGPASATTPIASSTSSGGTGGTGSTGGPGRTGAAAGPAGAGGTGTGAAAGSTGTTAVGAAGTTGGSGSSSTGVVPSGFPHTGEGGATDANNSGLVAVGLVALVAAIAVSYMAVRRRRSLAARGSNPLE